MNKFNIKKISKISIGVLLGIILISTIYIYINSTFNKTKSIENKAEEYFMEKDFYKSIDEFEKLYEEDKYPLWKAKIAQIYSVIEDKKSSNEYINMVKESKDNDAKTLNYIIFTEYMNKDYEKALKDGEKFYKIYPNNKDIINTMLAVYLVNSKFYDAKKIIKDYKVDEKSAYDIAKYGQMLIYEGEEDKGYKTLKKAWEINKDEHKVYDILVQMYLNNEKKVTYNIEKLIKENPKDIAYKMWMAKVYSINKNKVNESQKILNELNGKDIGKIEKNIIQYSIYEQINEQFKAEAIISKLVSDNKNNYGVSHIVSWYYLYKGDMKKAKEFAEKSISENPNYIDNYAFLVPEIFKRENISEKSEPYFRVALIKEPYNYNIIQSIGNYYLNTIKNNNKALENFMLAEKLNSKDSEIKYNIANTYLYNKDKEKAIYYLKKAISINNKEPKYYRTLGTIYFINKDFKLSLENIKYAYELNKEDILILNNIACYYMAGDTQFKKSVDLFKLAYSKVNKNTDEYTKKTIKDNYDKAKEFLDKVDSTKEKKELKIPELIMFY